MRLPRKPASLGGVKGALDQLIDYCKAITPKPSAGISYAFDSDGYRTQILGNDYQPIDPPFWCVQVGKESVRVYDSVLARNGVQRSIFNLEAGKTYALLTGFSTANETYYAYLELSNVGRTYHPAIAPDKMEAKMALCSTALFAADNFDNKTGNTIKIVAKVWTGANGIYKIEQWPDRDDWVYIPDSWGLAAAPGEKPPSMSLDLRPIGPDPTDHTPQGHVLELKDFWLGYRLTEFSPALDTLEFRQGTDNGAGAPTEPYTQRYVTLANLAAQLDPSEIGGGDINTIIEHIGDNIGSIVTYLEGEIPHNDLDFSGYGAIGTGVSGGSTDHDDAYLHIYNDGETGHANFINGLAAEDGDKEVRSVDPAWFSQLHLSADGSTDSQYWTAAAILANVTGAISLECNASSYWKSNTANQDLDIGTALKPWRVASVNAEGFIVNLIANGEFQINGSSGVEKIYLGTAAKPVEALYYNGKLVTKKALSDVGPSELVLTIEA